MDAHYCAKHDAGYFEDECPRCERDRLREIVHREEERRARGDYYRTRLLDM